MTEVANDDSTSEINFIVHKDENQESDLDDLELGEEQAVVNEEAAASENVFKTPTTSSTTSTTTTTSTSTTTTTTATTATTTTTTTSTTTTTTADRSKKFSLFIYLCHLFLALNFIQKLNSFSPIIFIYSFEGNSHKKYQNKLGFKQKKTFAKNVKYRKLSPFFLWKECENPKFLRKDFSILLDTLTTIS